MTVAADDVSPAVVVLAVALALIAAVLLAEAVAAALRAAGRRCWLWAHLARRTRNPIRLVLAVVAVRVGLGLALPDPSTAVDRACALGAVVALTWLAAVVAPTGVDAALGRHRTDTPGHRYARGSRALARAARTIALVAVLLAGLAGVLLIVPTTRGAGLAAAGLLALVLAAVAGAALPWLRDVVAGLELAAADALRLDDVIAVGGAAPGRGALAPAAADGVGTDRVWGRVEEITATTVVVQAWDDRRVVVPARRLADVGFENWTRRSADLVGIVDVDVDPAVPVADVRAALLRIVEANDLWDRRVAVLQVADATGGRVRLRAVVSAADAPRLADLRCDVREGLVDHLVRVRPSRPDGAAPPQPAGRHTGDTTMTVDPRKDSRLFTGSVFAVERSQSFTGPGAAVLAERDAAADA